MSTGDFTCSQDWGGRPVARQIAEAAPRSRVVVRGTIVAAKPASMAQVTCYTCTLDDGTGEIDLLFIGRRSIPGLDVGTTCTVEATANRGCRRLVLWNPLYRIEADADPGYG